MDKDKLGANTASLPNLELYDIIQKMEELGFRTIELLTFEGAVHSMGWLAGYWFHKMTPAERDKLRDALARFAHRAAHLPFMELPLFSYNKDMEEFCRKQLCIAMDGAAFMGVEVGVLHVNRRHGRTCREYWNDMVETYRFLGDYAAERGLRLAIETGFPNTFEDFTRLIFDIDHPQVGAAIDVGHFVGHRELDAARENPQAESSRRAYNDLLVRTVRTLGDKNYHFHLHDVRPHDGRDHRAAGPGIIDFERLCKVLHEIAYDGLLDFEIEEPDPAAALLESKRFIEGFM